MPSVPIDKAPIAELRRGCVFTVLLGRYEALNEQPSAAHSALDFICLTDDPDLRSETWSIRYVTPAFEKDQVRSQRLLKIQPWRLLASYDCSLYIDNSILLRTCPEALLHSVLRQHELALCAHSFRRDVEAEFAEVELLRFDHRTTLREQLEHYRSADPGSLVERPYWSGMLFRRHAGERLHAFADLWAAHVLRYSRRDQLSLNYSLRKSGLVPNVLSLDNHDSLLHSWPHVRDRLMEISRVG